MLALVSRPAAGYPRGMVEQEPAEGPEGAPKRRRPRAEHARSPLWMVADAPALHELVVTLRRALTDPAPRGVRRLELSRALVEDARAGFLRMTLSGERALHQLAGLLAESLLSSYQLRSSVIGAIEGTGERFTLEVDLAEEDLYGTTDLDLGNRLLARLRFEDGGVLRRARLVSNVVEYDALEPNPASVVRLLTRIKAEEEVWNKVADELFELDALVLRDKELRHLSRYVKDVFGLKVVVAGLEDVRKAQQALALLRFGDEALTARGLATVDAHRALEFIEVKDYLSRKSRKHSGWAAMKSVVRFGGRTFEIQVQPLVNFLRERERLTKESHAGFKSTREQVRDEVSTRVPLFGYTRALLAWLFVDSAGPPPSHPGVEVRLVD